jgi:hypothetical protein
MGRNSRRTAAVDTSKNDTTIHEKLTDNMMMVLEDLNDDNESDEETNYKSNGTVNDQPNTTTPTETTSKNSNSNNISSKMKCQLCNQRKRKDGCIQSACYQCCTSNDCTIHYKHRMYNRWKQQVLDGTTRIQVMAQKQRQLLIPIVQDQQQHQLQQHPSTTRKRFYYETNFIYQGETIVLWYINIYGQNPQYYHDAIRKSIRRNKIISNNYNNNNNQYNNSKQQQHSRLRINRKRFYRIMNDLYIRSTYK